MYDVPIVTTEHSAACGPACLKMLLGYYGTEVSMETLIQECNVRIGGCTGADLLRVGRDHGLDMTAWKMDAEEVIRQDRPSIIWWKYMHWCVCAGMENGDVVICNPSLGRYPIDAGSFKALYTGIAIFNGTPEDLPEGATPATAEDFEAALRGLGVDV